MEDDTANSATNTAVADEYQTENNLETEMTDAELEAFVDRTLGIKSKPVAKDDDKDADKTEDKTTEKAETKSEEKSEEKTTDDKKATDDKKVEDEKSKPVGDGKEFTIQNPTEPYKPAEVAEVQTDDLWVEIDAQVVDGEDESGQPVVKNERIKITLADGIPENVRFKNDKQLAETLEAIREMKEVLADREQEREEKLADEQKKVDADTNRKAVMDGWDAEISDLIQAGFMEAPKVGIGEDGFNDDPTVQKIDAVFKYMTAENEKRATEGRPRINSFGTAFNLYSKEHPDEGDPEAKAKADKEKTDAEEVAKKEAELTKKRGALVGGGSGGSNKGSAPVYKRGSAHSVYDVPTDDL